MENENLTENNQNQEEKLVYNNEGMLVHEDEIEKITDPRYFDPKQDIAWNYYIESILAGKPNIKASGIKAGYTPYAADKICKTKWFKERKATLSRSRMFSEAEKNLRDVLSLKYKGKKKNKESGEMEEVIDTDVAKIVIDVSKTLVKSLGKDIYSDRSEVSGPNGSPVFLPAELMDKFDLGQ